MYCGIVIFHGEVQSETLRGVGTSSYSFIRLQNVIKRTEPKKNITTYVCFYENVQQIKNFYSY